MLDLKKVRLEGLKEKIIYNIKNYNIDYDEEENTISDSYYIDEIKKNFKLPITYLTDKLGFITGDELQYNFMARKQDGKNCMIEGTFLGSPDGGIEPEDQPTIYRGDISACSSSNLPLY